MVRVRFTSKFQSTFYKIKDNLLKIKIIKQLKKIKDNPNVGKPMRNIRKGTRKLYIKPFRLSYSYLFEKELVYILDLYHKKQQ